MIDQATIERIIEASEITQVVSEFVTLRRRGVNLLGLCPFHNEKTPSFTVSPAKGIYKCFGCGKGGNAVNFIMDHEQLSYPEALKWLAKKYNIEIDEKEESEAEKQIRDERESMMILSDYAGKYFHRYSLKEAEGRTIGLSYLSERGIRGDIIKKFELGFCPEGKDAFTQEAQKQGYKMEFLEKTGLSIKRDDWVRDRFAGRVMFPIHNVAGRIIGFGGRILKEDKNSAKYLNSPESEIYHKGKVLYGLYQAKKDISRLDKCYLVEGYTDVLSFHQAGIENVVASSGTALTPDQIRLIKRFTPNITIIYDGDEAGIKASLRGIDLVLEEGINVKVLLLPDREDPDSFARSRGASELNEYIKNNETDFIKFKTQLLLQHIENDPIAKARLISDIVRSIAVIPEAITRSVYVKECSKLMEVQEEVLYAEIRKIKRKETEEHNRKEQREHLRTKQNTVQDLIGKSDPNRFEIEEKEILRILLKYFHQMIFEVEGENPHEARTISVGEYVISELDADELVLSNQVINSMINILRENVDNSLFEPGKQFINHSDVQIAKMASDLLAEKYVESKRWSKAGAFVEAEKDILNFIVPRLIQEYKLKKVKLMLQQLEKQIQEASLTSNFELIFQLQNQHVNLKKMVKYLAENLGNRAVH